MKHVYSTLALAAAVGLSAMSPGDAIAQAARGRDQVCVYEHANYGGWEQCYGAGEAIRDLGDRRNSISSVRIQGRAEITLYEHPDFQGSEVTLSGNVPDIKRSNRRWNDQTDSLRVISAGFRGGRPEPGQRRADRVCVYQHVRFQGNSQCWDGGDDIPDLKSIGWNDGISSIRTFGRIRVAVFEHAGFQGQRLIVEGDLEDLTKVSASGGSNWNDRISSLRIEGDRRGGRRGDGRD